MRTDESNPLGERGNLDIGQTIPVAATTEAGMTVVSSKRAVKYPREGRKATQDRRSGNPGEKRPDTGVKLGQSGASHSLLAGEGPAVSTVFGTSPPARGDDPNAATSAPDIARQGDTSGGVHPPAARTFPPLTAGEIVYQRWEEDAEIAETRDAGTVRGWARWCLKHQGHLSPGQLHTGNIQQDRPPDL